MDIRGSLYNWLGKKIEKSEIQTIYSNAEQEYAFKKLAYEIAISYIANAITKCQFKVYKNNEEYMDEEYYKLNISPNPNQNASELWEKTVKQLYRKGEALVVPKKGFLYCADSFQTNKEPFTGNVYEKVTVSKKEINKKYKESEVYHFKLETNLDTLLNDTYSKYAEIMAYAIKSYTRSNSEKYKLVLSNLKAGDEEFQKTFNEVIKKQLESFIKNDNAVYPQFEGYDLQKMTSSKEAKDSKDFIQLRQDTFETIASTFKMPTKMLYGDMNNVEEVVNQFLTFAVDPLAKSMSEELTRKSMSFGDWKKGNYIKIDTTSVNHIDILNVGEKVDKLIASGTTNIDEIRVRIGLNELNTDFSKQFWITKNYDTVENLLKSILKGGGNNGEKS